MTENHQEAYVLDRNPEESARLNVQHAFLVDLIGSSPIHPSIPISGIRDVADIATGTGVWLRDTASLLASRNPNLSRPYYLHGFDISAAQFQSFPTEKNTKIHLSVQDCLQPFPAEHHGRYDVVHLRLLIGALRASEYEAAVKNVYDILSKPTSNQKFSAFEKVIANLTAEEPGGYLQWDEASMAAFSTDEYPQPPLITEIKRIIGHVIDTRNLSHNPPELIEHEAKRAGFVRLSRELYTTRSRPHLADPARAWLTHLVRTLIPLSMIKSGEVSEQKIAKARTEALMAEFEKHCVQALPLVNLQVIIGMKPKVVQSVL